MGFAIRKVDTWGVPAGLDTNVGFFADLKASSKVWKALTTHIEGNDGDIVTFGEIFTELPALKAEIFDLEAQRQIGNQGIATYLRRVVKLVEDEYKENEDGFEKMALSFQ